MTPRPNATAHAGEKGDPQQHLFEVGQKGNVQVDVQPQHCVPLWRAAQRETDGPVVVAIFLPINAFHAGFVDEPFRQSERLRLVFHLIAIEQPEFGVAFFKERAILADEIALNSQFINRVELLL
ncbi:hypothetical protein [Vibrio vulnificus]|uniref:hypothetical protein n=1 Tax=Vibrio vulnificus TaxID=672 RepID=UPI001EEC51B3|nr:hypothetical protein [Vibrio vulnificus]MCG6294325.1 hypothetical protein [Vibrio vulnificus]